MCVGAGHIPLGSGIQVAPVRSGYELGMPATVDVEMVLDQQLVVAGEALRGTVPGGAREVQIVRRERSPTGSFVFHVAAVEPDAGDRFEVEIPAAAAPTWDGTQCAVSYLAIARRDRTGRRRREHIGTSQFAVHTGQPQAGPPSFLHDRMIANFDGRHFRVELSGGELCGGGSLSGRAHLQPNHPIQPEAAVVRCMESWRVDRSLKPNRPPVWRIALLWEQAAALDWSQPGTWVPFSFRLPSGLPPAFEGRTVAWRYEIELRRRRRFRLAHRAVLTPTGFGLR